MLELHCALRSLNDRCVNNLRYLLLLIEQFEDTLSRGHRRLNDVGEVRELSDRLGKLLCVLDERLHIPDGNSPIGDHDAADHGHKDIAEVADKTHQRHDHARSELRPPPCIIQILV